MNGEDGEEKDEDQEKFFVMLCFVFVFEPLEEMKELSRRSVSLQAIMSRRSIKSRHSEKCYKSGKMTILSLDIK